MKRRSVGVAPDVEFFSPVKAARARGRPVTILGEAGGLPLSDVRIISRRGALLRWLESEYRKNVSGDRSPPTPRCDSPDPLGPALSLVNRNPTLDGDVRLLPQPGEQHHGNRGLATIRRSSRLARPSLRRRRFRRAKTALCYIAVVSLLFASDAGVVEPMPSQDLGQLDHLAEAESDELDPFVLKHWSGGEL